MAETVEILATARIPGTPTAERKPRAAGSTQERTGNQGRQTTA
jgi:hypothetical protein